MIEENIIELRSVTKDYKKERGIFDFNIQVAKGEVFGLMGSNGSGKTTTIRHMMGFLQCDRGEIKIQHMDAWKDAAKIKKLVGYVPGQIDFPDVGTGTEFLKIQAELMGLKNIDYMNELIDRFKIDITVPLKRMSKGMKQKMAIVVAFMGQPEIYFLDEPSTGLDPLMRDTLIELILEQKAKGRTVFMSSHIFKEVEDTCDEVMFIEHGHIVNTIKRDCFQENAVESYTISFASEKEFTRFLTRSHPLWDAQCNNDFIETRTNDDKITVTVPSAQLNEFFHDLSNYTISGLSHEPYTLEQYYIDHISNREEMQYA